MVAVRLIDRTRGNFVVIMLLQTLLLSFFFGTGNMWVFTLSGGCCLASYVYAMRIEFRQNRMILTPMFIFLFSGVIRIGLVPIWALICDFQGHEEAFYFTRYDVRSFIIEGQFLMVLGDALFVAGFAIFQVCCPPKTSPRRSLEGIEPGYTAYATMMIISPLIVFSLLAPGLLAGLGRLGNYFTEYGMIAVILLMLISRRIGRPVPWSIIGIILGVALLQSLRSYMKQSTVVVVLPFALVVPLLIDNLNRYRSKAWFYPRIAAGFVIAGLGIAWLFSYSEIRRGDFWVGSSGSRHSLNRSEVPVGPAAKKAALSLIPWTEESALYHQLPDRGIWSFFSRHACALAAGWTFNAKKAQGTMDGELIQTGLISVIPRLFWPEKPQISVGRKIAVLLGQAQSEETATTATSLGGMAAYLYMDLGWPWLVAGMTMSGALFALFSHVFLPRLNTNPFAAVSLAGFYVLAIRHFESSYDAGLADYAYSLIVSLPMAWFWDRFFHGPKKGR